MQPDASEAAELFDLVVDNAGALREARLGPRFRLGQAGFVLFRRARNTIYRVSGRTEWYLKLTSEANAQVMEHERLGAVAIDQALGGHPDYRGAPLTRVSLDPPFVLASSIPGEALNRLFFKECWTPGGAAGVRLEKTFHLLGSLLAVLHQDAEVPVTPATTRPFKVLDTLLSHVREPDAVIDAIASWQDRHRQSDEGATFQHGNFRLDNIIRTPEGLGFIDLENCGSGTQYQDLSRPVLDLLLSRALPVFPWSRAERCLTAFLSGYSQAREIDAVQLWKLVAVRLSRYYVEAHAKQSRISFGGLPVSRNKLARLVVAFLRSELDGFHAIQPGNA